MKGNGMEEVKILKEPELSEWECRLFGTGEKGMVFSPIKGNEPNWFWRVMQYLILGNKWVKKQNEGNGMEKVRTIASAKPVVMTRKERILMLIPILIVMGIVVVSLIVLIGG